MKTRYLQGDPVMCAQSTTFFCQTIGPTKRHILKLFSCTYCRLKRSIEPIHRRNHSFFLKAMTEGTVFYVLLFLMKKYRKNLTVVFSKGAMPFRSIDQNLYYTLYAIDSIQFTYS